jgi:agmatine deiminase
MTVAEMGFAMPAEWTRQEAIWLSWPVADERHWAGAKHSLMQAKFAEIAAAISHFENVCINAPHRDHQSIRAACLRAKINERHLHLFDHPNNDVWCRDHGPIFVKHPQTGEVAVTNWGFNAWGGKFPPWDLDDAIPQRIAEQLGIRCFPGGMILEGGAIEVNAAGQLLTTEAVLLNQNRNPQLGRQEVEQLLRDGLGMKEILWLRGGIEGDDTDGHIDDLVRFVSDGALLACVDPDSSSTNHKILLDNWNDLSEFRTVAGGSFDMLEMPMPQACEVPGWRLPVLPASYVNYLLVNDGVLVPQFRQKKNDQRALAIIKEIFPDREIVAIDCLDLVEEGGTLHCISQQQPAAGC